MTQTTIAYRGVVMDASGHKYWTPVKLTGRVMTVKGTPHSDGRYYQARKWLVFHEWIHESNIKIMRKPSVSYSKLKDQEK